MLNNLGQYILRGIAAVALTIPCWWILFLLLWYLSFFLMPLVSGVIYGIVVGAPLARRLKGCSAGRSLAAIIMCALGSCAGAASGVVLLDEPTGNFMNWGYAGWLVPGAVCGVIQTLGVLPWKQWANLRAASLTVVTGAVGSALCIASMGNNKEDVSPVAVPLLAYIVWQCSTAAMLSTAISARHPPLARSPRLPAIAAIEFVPLTIFPEPKGCREFHDRLQADGVEWRTQVKRAAAAVFVNRLHEQRARRLLQEHLATPSDLPKTGFQITHDYAIFGGLIAGSFGMVLLALEFQHASDLVRPLMLVLLGAIVGWVLEKGRVSHRATGSFQFSAANFLVAGGAALLAGILFLGALAS